MMTTEETPAHIIEKVRQREREKEQTLVPLRISIEELPEDEDQKRDPVKTRVIIFDI